MHRNTLFFVVCMGLLGCTTPPPPTVSAEPPPAAIEKRTPEQALAGVETRVLEALAKQDMAAVAAEVHPSQGVRFSLYAHVVPGKDVVLSREEVARSLTDPQVRLWGTADGSGEPVQLTYADFHRIFVYPRDFKQAPEQAYNRILGQGNSLNNLAQSYAQSAPGAIVVEYHFPHNGKRPWSSLNLIFAQEGGSRWWLVGLAHATWTI